MSYLVLARKWRPRTFGSLVGQDHVVRALTHALETQRLHHAWLFTGTRGVGKTTLSRILAKSLNCEQGITATPCGQCQACTEIDAGRFVDYVELDAASNRGVDEMTQLLEQAVYAPGAGRFKVYMIDEVHMLTGHAFNAMLKTLEEPPPHVKFILATTDPQKIPVTVLSRCLQFNLKQMPASLIVEHLQAILGEEGMGFEVPALRLIAQAASGSMRDALSLTDQAIAYSAENLTLDAIQEMLGTIDQRYLVRLLQALASSDAAGVLAIASELAARGLSYQGALADLAVLLSRVAIVQRVGSGFDADDPLAPSLADLAGALHPDLVQLFYSVAVHSRTELALAPDEYAGFVMACLRMLALAPADVGPINTSGSTEGNAQKMPSGPKPGSAASELERAEAQIPPASNLPGASAPTQDGAAELRSGAEAVQTPPPTAQEPVSQAAWEGESAWENAATAAAADTAVVRPAQVMSDEVTTVPQPKTETADVAAPRTRQTSRSAPQRKPQPVVQPHAQPEPQSAAPPLQAESVSQSAPQPRAETERQSAQTEARQESTAQTPAAQQPITQTLNQLVPDDGLPVWDVPPDSAYDDGDRDSGSDWMAELNGGSDEQGTVLAESTDDEDVAGNGAAQVDAEALSDVLQQTAAVQGAVGASAGKTVSGRGKALPYSRLNKITAADWPKLVAQLPLSGVAAELARQSEWDGVNGARIRLRVGVQVFAEAAAGKERLVTVLSEHFGEAVSLDVQFGSTGDGTAHAIEQARLQQLQKQAEAEVEADPLIHELIQRFDARVVPDSIRAMPAA